MVDDDDVAGGGDGVIAGELVDDGPVLPARLAFARLAFTGFTFTRFAFTGFAFTRITATGFAFARLAAGRGLDDDLDARLGLGAVRIAHDVGERVGPVETGVGGVGDGAVGVQHRRAVPGAADGADR